MFNLHRSKNKKWFFTITAANGETVAMSEMYESKQGAKKGIEALCNAVILGLTEQIRDFTKKLK